MSMDPNETLRLARIAFTEGRLEDAAQHYSDLDNWINQGGFPPSDWPVVGMARRA
jgi:hypothetical protein